MTITEAADYFKTTERTVSSWREKGAPVEHVAELMTWLEENLRHSSREVQAVITRHRQIESRGKDFIRAYIVLREAFPDRLQSDWECYIIATLNMIDSHMESIVLFLNPDLATNPKEKSACERLHADVWPVTGNEPTNPKKTF